MDEFLQKLEADQERLRQHLRGLASRFQKIGETLAQARNDRTRVFLTGEGTLEGAAQVIAEEYLRSWPVVFVSLASDTALDTSSEAEAAEKTVPGPVKDVIRHFREGDVLLVFAHGANTPELRAIMNLAHMRGVKNVVVGGLDARQDTRELYDIFIPLPTRGVKTLCESSFICARLMARCARSHFAESYDQEDARLIRLICRECQETVFIEERFAGQKGLCPFCRKALRVPKPRRGSRKIAEPDSDVVAEDEGARKRKRKRSEESRRSKRRKTGTRRHKRRSSESREVAEAKELDKAEANEGSETRSASSRKRRGRSSDSRRSSKRRRGEGRASSSRRSKTNAEAEAENEAELEGAVPETKAEPEEIKPGDERSNESSVVIHVSSWLAEAEKEESQPIGIGSELRSSGILSELRFDSEDDMPAYIADALVPSHSRDASASQRSKDAPAADGQRVVSNRFVIQDCMLRFSIGDYPDENGPRHSLLSLSPDDLSFRLNKSDDAAATLSRGDELWVRIDIPAFLEPIYARGSIKRFTEGAKSAGQQVDLAIDGIDPEDHRRLTLAAERAVSKA